MSKRRRFLFSILLVAVLSIWAAGQKSAIEIVKVDKGWRASFALSAAELMEKSMQALEGQDIFIAKFDPAKRFIATEFKSLKSEKVKDLVTINLAGASFDIFRYQYRLTVYPREGQGSDLETSAVIKGHGRPIRIMGARPGWYTLPSNGNLEKELLTAIEKSLR
jgi:hypothetical protein